MSSTSNQTGAGPSSPRTQQRREELQRLIEEYTRRIREYENNKRARGKQPAQNNDSIKANQKKVSIINQRLLNEMLTIEDECSAKGFVYGMVTETGKSVTGASDSLRAWWKGQVMFDKTGPVQIEKYYKENALPLHLEQEKAAKSTMELLMEISDPTLGSILSVLMQHCEPPQRKYPFEKDENPPWWPTAKEAWWGQTGIPAVEGPPPYKKPHNLKKKWKAAAVLGIIKVMSPHFWLPYHLVDQSRILGKRMTANERKICTLVLVAEAKRYCQDHTGDGADKAATFLHAYASNTISQLVTPNVNNQEIVVPPNEAPLFGNLSRAMQHPLAALSNTPEAWPSTASQMNHSQQGIEVINAAPDQHIPDAGSFAPQYFPWAFSYNHMLPGNITMGMRPNHTIRGFGASISGLPDQQAHANLYMPFAWQPGGMPFAGGSQDGQNQVQEYGAHMQPGFQAPSSNQGG